MTAGRACGADGMKGVVVEVLQRKTLPKDVQMEELAPGIEAGLRVLERSVSTAALMQ